MPLPIITEADDPRHRAVTYDPNATTAVRPRVYEYPGERIEGEGHALAVIGEAGSAYALLNAAIEVDVRDDLKAYAASSIRSRSGKHDAAWVHPAHGEAPTAPCINERPGR